MDPNLLIIIGNAAVDDTFLDKLFEDPQGTVKDYGFQLNPDEQAGLKALTGSPENKNNLKAMYVCPHKPCVGIALPPPCDAPPVTKEPPKVA